MDSFEALWRREENPQNFGEFRTKCLILERYDAQGRRDENTQRQVRRE
jgi:hypothetical protein